LCWCAVKNLLSGHLLTGRKMPNCSLFWHHYKTEGFKSYFWVNISIVMLKTMNVFVNLCKLYIEISNNCALLLKAVDSRLVDMWLLLVYRWECTVIGPVCAWQRCRILSHLVYWPSVVRGDWTSIVLFRYILRCLYFVLYLVCVFSCTVCLSVSVKWLAVKTSSEMT